ncbi:MAG: MBL fold metallo-hydrolase, partial [Deltaproteobacteria bacterium]|nr:MBL fold metallo-hydrolase [Deltaproteobacteria bacterium]
MCDGIWLEKTPGHTPGHVSIRLASKGQQAVITG